MVVALAVSGCKRGVSSWYRPAPGTSGDTERSSPDARLAELEARAEGRLDKASTLPTRAEIVALADELVVASAKMEPGPQALHLSRLAADLRARMWRVGHADADAREAIELYRESSRTAAKIGAMEEGCQDALGHAVLAAELARAPALLYREVYRASKLFDAPLCEDRFSRVLKSLGPFRPSQDELAALDAESEEQRIGARKTTSTETHVVSDDLGLVLAPSAAARGQRIKVVAIQPYGSRDRARVVITLSGAASYRVGELTGPRLFVDLEKTDPSRARDIPVGGLVQRIRQAPHREGSGGDPSTRIVLDLSTRAYRRIFYLLEPFRVVVDAATHPPEKTSYAPGEARIVSRIALDAGHGGSDPGAIGPSGLREKDVTLDIAHLAAPLLSRELGILTLLTRDDDRLVPLDERAARANAFHADLFVSIHCNASDSDAPRGVMSFVLDTSRDEIAAKVAARENAMSVAATSEVASIARGLRLAETVARSTRFAELLQRSTLASLLGRFDDANDQGVKTAGFLVLVGAEMPSVVFETSFISNPAEEKRLATADYRQRLADGIVNAVRAYREGR